MKLNYFYGSIAVKQCDGWTENLEFNITESKELTFRYPYGDNTPEEAYAVSTFIKTVNEAYNRLTNQINNVNRDLRLEQYAPQQSTEVSVSESTEVSAVPQSSRLGDGEVSTGADGDIDKPKSTIVITKVTEEDDW